MLGTYVGFRYALFILSMIGIITLNALAEAAIWEYIAALIVFIVYFILDIGLSVILHSIWVARKKTAGTEKPMKNKQNDNPQSRVQHHILSLNILKSS